ncbi:hypothetical protein BX616_010830 [Lobosporangium transversale]|uniref:Profilin n=1 Tax=Lobosporangium transversale TaxID=64571 RepID=A0A1Y2G7P3_9FUNG|nr:profilin [Lobosporangium transversale]KAF9910619.1 hypothetical protein BX616_010830 [Lobosporangium transversale]ORY98248.1 profilin [Lobosporangium transversale]|eukprot:XP_021875677.1 profilin [Lobosporangium transversale]
MSSFAALIDDKFIKTGKVTKAAILGIDGSISALSSNFELNESEAKMIVAAFDGSTGGLRIEGKMFEVEKSHKKNSIHATCNDEIGSGVVCVKTGMVILIGYYDHKVNPIECIEVVESVAEDMANGNV